MNHLECRSVDFSYPLKNKTFLPVLGDFNFQLDEGEIVSFLGPSGCGKTTALNLLAGFMSPQKGSITLKGDDLINPCSRGQMIFQDSTQLLPWLTVEDNILFPVKRSYLPGMKPRLPGEVKEKLDRILSLVGLSDFRHYHPVRLSGGMKQRCALGRALMAEAEIIFMDEPFGALDTPSRRELQKLLLELWKERKFSVVFVTHDIPEALSLSDRILLFSSAGTPVKEIPFYLDRPRNRKDPLFRAMEIELFTALSDSE